MTSTDIFWIILAGLLLETLTAIAFYALAYQRGYHDGHADRHDDGDAATYTHPKIRS
jgi:hypothetical protein